MERGPFTSIDEEIPCDYSYSFYESYLVFMAPAAMVYHQFPSGKSEPNYVRYSWVVLFIDINGGLFKNKKHLFMRLDP